MNDEAKFPIPAEAPAPDPRSDPAGARSLRTDGSCPASRRLPEAVRRSSDDGYGWQDEEHMFWHPPHG